MKLFTIPAAIILSCCLLADGSVTNKDWKIMEARYDDNITVIEFEAPDVDIPDEIDWRREGAVTLVKDQQTVGAAWPFAATGALEAQYFRKTGKLVSLSQSNLVDCVNDDGNIISAFKYVHNNDGIDSEEGYPTVGVSQCKYDVQSNVTSMTNKVLKIKEGSEESLKVALAVYGPVAVGIEAGHTSFQTYTGGVYYEAQCSSALNHEVLVVGYGTENNEDYWLVKNSWGPFWGEQGYIKMARNRENNCGIASYAVLPILYK